MAESYKLYTLRDVLEKVPPDKIRVCMEELAATMEVLARQHRASEKVSSEPHLILDFPDGFEWAEGEGGSFGRLSYNVRVRRALEAGG